MFPYSFSVPPLAIIAGALASALKKYHFLNIIAWCLIVIGIGLHTILRVNSNTGTWVIVQIVAGAGFGILVRNHFVNLALLLKECSTPQPHLRSCPLFLSLIMLEHSRCSFSFELSFK